MFISIYPNIITTYKKFPNLIVDKCNAFYFFPYISSKTEQKKSHL